MANDALFQLGIALEAPSTSQTEDTTTAPAEGFGADERKDHFVVKDGIRCAGTHLIIDLHGAERLDDIGYMEETLIECVEVAGATLLHIHLHRFEPTGVSGVAVLAESHISVHSWPENDYAAFDVFMCGDARPELCVDVLKRAFRPDEVVVTDLLRGEGV